MTRAPRGLDSAQTSRRRPVIWVTGIDSAGGAVAARGWATEVSLLGAAAGRTSGRRASAAADDGSDGGGTPAAGCSATAALGIVEPGMDAGRFAHHETAPTQLASASAPPATASQRLPPGLCTAAGGSHGSGRG